MAHPLVVRRNQPHDVYIGRPSKWGNPFKIGRDGTREEVIAKHAEWIQYQSNLLAALSELRDKRLGCYCAPLPCHGDTLAMMAARQAAPGDTGEQHAGDASGGAA